MGIKERLSTVNSKIVNSTFDKVNISTRNVTEIMSDNMMKRTLRWTGRGAKITAFGVASTAMAGISFMNGAMSQAQDIMYDRYMRDAKYSSRLLTRTNIGKSSGQSPLNITNHTGLSLAMSRNRHG